MKKSILTSLVVLASVACLFAQQKSAATAPAAFTKQELFAFSDVKSLLSAVNKEKYSSLNVVRSFNLTMSTTYTDASGNTGSISLSELAPDGEWTEKQKAIIDQYGKSGVVFNLEAIVMGKLGVPGTPYIPDVPFSVPSVSFSIK